MEKGKPKKKRRLNWRSKRQKKTHEVGNHPKNEKSENLFHSVEKRQSHTVNYPCWICSRGKSASKNIVCPIWYARMTAARHTYKTRHVRHTGNLFSVYILLLCLVSSFYGKLWASFLVFNTFSVLLLLRRGWHTFLPFCLPSLPVLSSQLRLLRTFHSNENYVAHKNGNSNIYSKKGKKTRYWHQNFLVELVKLKQHDTLRQQKVLQMTHATTMNRSQQNIYNKSYLCKSSVFSTIYSSSSYRFPSCSCWLNASKKKN